MRRTRRGSRPSRRDFVVESARSSRLVVMSRRTVKLLWQSLRLADLAA